MCCADEPFLKAGVKTLKSFSGVFNVQGVPNALTSSVCLAWLSPISTETSMHAPLKLIDQEDIGLTLRRLTDSLNNHFSVDCS
jgi:hypothetical protein